jgi:hypothetical protein
VLGVVLVATETVLHQLYVVALLGEDHLLGAVTGRSFFRLVEAIEGVPAVDQLSAFALDVFRFHLRTPDRRSPAQGGAQVYSAFGASGGG